MIGIKEFRFTSRAPRRGQPERWVTPVVPLLVLLAVPLAFAGGSVQISGSYLRYTGAEYESAFRPCGTNEVWAIHGGRAEAVLIRAYRASPKSEYGEVLVNLLLDVTRVDTKRFPNSHYAATARVTRVMSVGGSTSCPSSSR